MKVILIIIIASILLAIAALSVLGYMSQSGRANGLVEGRLTQCPDTPNCVCSEFAADAAHYIGPLVISSDDTAQIMGRLKSIIREMGGSIEQERDNYLAATFTSAIFRFVDDLEIRIDLENNLIHLRSASRVGRSDGGVNRQRIDRVKKSY